MSDKVVKGRCHVCGARALKRVTMPFETQVRHDGRGPLTVRIPDLEVVKCTNPDCRPEHPDDTILEDGATAWRITAETYRQLGLLTPDEIRAGRQQLGLTQQQLQDLLGLGGNTLSRWEKGHVYQSRSSDKLLRLVFGLPAAVTFLESRVSEAS